MLWSWGSSLFSAKRETNCADVQAVCVATFLREPTNA